MLHTMLRLGDLERSPRFCCDLLGMKELRRKDYRLGDRLDSIVGMPPGLRSLEGPGS